MKAYKLEGDQVGIFRPELHAKRFSKSAEKMAMAEFSPELFMESILAYVKACKTYVPKEPGHSLYLRPLLFANEPVIKVKSSESYRFIIMGSIVGPYFKNNDQKGSKVLINKSFIRAFPGGTGEAKTSANYALSLNALEYAQSKGFDQVLYVDAMKKEKIEELGGMNFFMVQNNELYTPKLDGQILHGVTRQSIIEIAKELKIPCRERDVLLTEIISSDVNEVFATGTAASIAPLAEIGVQENLDQEISNYKFPKHELSLKLLKYLTETQIGKTELSNSWLHVL
jgi:branched-chain amino acid aminotransferase